MDNSKEHILRRRKDLSDKILAETGKRPTAEELRAMTEPLRAEKVLAVSARGRKDGFEILSEEMITNGNGSYRARRYLESQNRKNHGNG